MPRLFAYSVRHPSMGCVFAGHIMSRDASEARGAALASYAASISAENVAKVRAYSAETADYLSSLPPAETCAAVARPSKAAKASDWV